MKRRVLLALSAAALLASSARASDDDVDLDVRAPGFDTAALRARVGADLHRSVLPPGAGASVHLFVNEVDGSTIVGVAAGERQVTRRVVLPPDRVAAEETLELMLVEMARTEAIPPAATAPAPASKAPPPPPARATVHPRPPPPRPAPAPHTPPAGAPEQVVPVALDFAPFVGFSSATRARDVRFFSLGAAGSVTRDLHGLGLDGTVGVATHGVRGAQIAGVVAVAGATEGAQVSGVLAVTAHDAAGAQLAGIANVAGDVAGLQLSGVLNVAGGDVHGAQIGGVMNVATGHVHGAQIGLVNVADESDAPIGLFNFIKHGRHHVDVWGSEMGLFMAGAQLGGKYTHAIIGIGVRPGPEGPRFVFGGGVGVHVDLTDRLALDLDLLHHDLAGFVWTNAQLSQARLVVDLPIARGLRVFGGPTFNVFVSDDPKDTQPSPFGSWAFGAADRTHVALWPGVTLGGRLL